MCFWPFKSYLPESNTVMTSFELKDIHYLCQLPTTSFIFPNSMSSFTHQIFLCKEAPWLHCWQELIEANTNVQCTNLHSTVAARVPHQSWPIDVLYFPTPQAPLPQAAGLHQSSQSCNQSRQVELYYQTFDTSCRICPLQMIAHTRQFQNPTQEPRHVIKSSCPFGLIWIFTCFSLGFLMDDLRYCSSWCGEPKWMTSLRNWEPNRYDRPLCCLFLT